MEHDSDNSQNSVPPLFSADGTPLTSAEIEQRFREERDRLEQVHAGLNQREAALASQEAQAHAQAHAQPSLSPQEMLASMFNQLNILATNLHSQQHSPSTSSASPTRSASVTSTPKIKPPETFEGCREGSKSKVRNFISQCDLYFRLQPERFISETAKVYFAASYLRGDAYNWIETYVTASDADLLRPSNSWFLTWDGFQKKLQSTFGDPDLKASNARKLTSLHQTSGVPVYTAEFKRLAFTLDWNDEALLHHYYQGLKDSVKDILAREDLPTSLESLIAAAERIGNRQHVRSSERDTRDSHTRSTNPARPSNPHRNENGTFKPSSSSSSGPTPSTSASYVPDASGNIQMGASRQRPGTSQQKRGPLTDAEKAHQHPSLIARCLHPLGAQLHSPGLPKRWGRRRVSQDDSPAGPPLHVSASILLSNQYSVLTCDPFPDDSFPDIPSSTSPTIPSANSSVTSLEHLDSLSSPDEFSLPWLHQNSPQTISANEEEHLIIPIELSSQGLSEPTFAMVDSGSQSFAMISQDYANALELPTIQRSHPRGIEGFNGAADASGLSEFTAPVLVKIGEHSELICFDITTLAHYPIVLGIPWLKAHHPLTDWKANSVAFPSEFCANHCLIHPNIVSGLPTHPHDSLAAPISGARAYEVRRRQLWKAKAKVRKSASRASPSIPTPSLPPLLGPPIAIVSSAAFRLSAKHAQVFQLRYHDLETRSEGGGESMRTFGNNLGNFPSEELKWDEDEKVNFQDHVPAEYHDFADLFEKKAGDALPRRRPCDHIIPIEEGAKIPDSRIYPLSATELESLRKYLDENLNRGFIRPSSSPVAAPILFVKKKDGSLRLCVDFRNLNSVTIKNKYPVPLVGETLDRLGKAKFFTAFDLRNGYHHIRIAEGEEWKTAFHTRYGHFEYQVMPFGLTNAPASFQGFMNDVFSPFLDRFVVVYIDDILVYSNTLEEHKIHVRQVLNKTRENGLFANAKKCSFHRSETEYLGYIVSPQGVTMNPKKVECIRNWPVPRSVKDVQSFLGFANFYRRFIRGFSAITSPLSRLTKKGVAFHMTPNALEAFEALKIAFTTAPVLIHFQPGVQLVLEMDSSDFATAAVISQKVDGVLHPIAFFSRKLQPAELNYEIHDKELLPIIESYRHWRAYLEGATEPTLIYTDHRNLEFFFSSKVLSRRQSRWYELIAGRNFQLIHRPGRLQGKTDTLSRRSDYAIGSKASDSPPIIFFSSPSLQIHADHLDPNPLPVFDEPFPSLRDELLAYQDRDPQIRQVLQDLRLSENLGNHPDKWSLDEEGLLRWNGAIYVPIHNALRLRILHLTHDAEEAGHRGVDRTIEKFRRTYYFPGCHEYIKNYVNTCDSCHRAKPLRQRQQGFLKPLPVPTGPWKSLSMDFIVKLPRTSRGFDSIFVIVDRLTKFATLIPFSERGSTAPDIARLFYSHIVGSHGLPLDIVSDRGSIFTSDFWQCLQELTRVRSNLSTAFHPQTDGQTERVNQSIEQIIRIYTNYQQDDWDELLPLAQFAYNDSKHSATGTTPFLANYGYSPRLDVSQPSERHSVSERSAEAFVKRMQKTHELIRTEIDAANIRAAKYYDARKSEAPVFQTGEQVFLSARNIHTKRPAKKLDSKFLGPFKIVRPIGSDDIPSAYELELPAEMQIHNVFHVSLLHRQPPNTIPDRHHGPPPLTEVDGEFENEVERILDSRHHRLKLQYRIRWVGFDASHDEWLDADDVLHAEDAILDFHDAYPDKPAPGAVRGSSRVRRGATRSQPLELVSTKYVPDLAAAVTRAYRALKAQLLVPLLPLSTTSHFLHLAPMSDSRPDSRLSLASSSLPSLMSNPRPNSRSSYRLELPPLLSEDDVAHLQSDIVEIINGRLNSERVLDYLCKTEDGGTRWVRYTDIDPSLTEIWQDSLSRKDLLKFFPMLMTGLADTFDKLPIQIRARDPATSPWEINETDASIRANTRSANSPRAVSTLSLPSSRPSYFLLSRDRLVVQFLRASRLQFTTTLQAMGESPVLHQGSSSRSTTPTPAPSLPMSTTPVSTSALRSTVSDDRLALVRRSPPFPTTPLEVMGPPAMATRGRTAARSTFTSSTSSRNSPTPSTSSPSRPHAPVGRSLKRQHSQYQLRTADRDEDVAPRGGATVTRVEMMDTTGCTAPRNARFERPSSH
ncbi:hypothetical protein P7C70_g5887, partial [Phenoliferia sp. Uapishka_3]